MSTAISGFGPSLAPFSLPAASCPACETQTAPSLPNAPAPPAPSGKSGNIGAEAVAAESLGRLDLPQTATLPLTRDTETTASAPVLRRFSDAPSAMTRRAVVAYGSTDFPQTGGRFNSTV